MANSSILGGTPLAGERAGKDLHALGPSDNSDSGSDAIGAYGDDALSADSDAAGTGERASADGMGGRSDSDILPDTLVGGDELDAGDSDDMESLESDAQAASAAADLASESDADTEEDIADDAGDDMGDDINNEGSSKQSKADESDAGGSS